MADLTIERLSEAVAGADSSVPYLTTQHQPLHSPVCLSPDIPTEWPDKQRHLIQELHGY